MFLPSTNVTAKTAYTMTTGTSPSTSQEHLRRSDSASGAARGGSSSRGSSVGSMRSPMLHPSNVDAMANSVISNLDLADEATTNNEQQGGLTGSSSVLTAIAEQGGLPRASLPSSENTSIARLPSSSSSNSITRGNTSFIDADTSSFARPLGTGADDSALNALMEAHASPSSSSDHDTPNRPSRRDASFGLDPDADTHQALHGQALVSHLVPSPLGKASHHRAKGSTEGEELHHQHHPSHHHSHAPSHTTVETGAPQTTVNESDVKTIPTVSATGMPRIWPRRTSRSPSPSGEEKAEGGRNRRRANSSSSRASSSQASAPREMQPTYAPSGSLTIALFSSGITWRRRSYLLLASLAINLGLPFLNGVMLGFGEIFARTVLAPFIGLAPAAININAPGAANTGRARASVANVGLRDAGKASDKETLYKRQNEA